MGNMTAQLLELLRIFQEVNDLKYFFFGFIATSHVTEGHGIAIFINEACLGFTKGECTPFAATLHLPHHKKPKTNNQ